MVNLTQSERRALLIFAVILAVSAIIQWVRPHKLDPKPFDYTLQDSLFKVLSADTLQPLQNREAVPAKPKKSKKKKKQSLLPHSIDVNRADVPTLEKLPRIGPKTAQAIIEYRRQHGPFKTIEDLDNVKGIGPKTIEKIKPFIFLSPPDSSKR